MQQSRFDVSKAPIPPLRAEPRFSAQTDDASHIQGVPASPGGLIRRTLLAGGSALAILVLFWLCLRNMALTRPAWVASSA